MSEEIKDTSVKDTSVKDTSVENKSVEEVEEKRFAINVDSGVDGEGKKVLFSFSGPEKAPIGLIYDAVHRILMEVSVIIQKRSEVLKPKQADTSVADTSVADTSIVEEVVEASVADTSVADTSVADTSVADANVAEKK